MSELIRVENLHKHYEMAQFSVPALDGVDICIDQGELISLVGASGSGKTTLMNVLGGLDTLTSGSYHLKERNITNMSEQQLAQIRNEEFGFVFQNFNLISSMTALDNVALPGKYRRMASRECRELAKASLEKVGLSDRMKHLPKELSGGQQQRVAFARALLCTPSILLADEPTGNLDSKTGLEILVLIEKLHEQGTTIILVTHDNEIANKANRKITLKDGKIIMDTAVKRGES